MWCSVFCLGPGVESFRMCPDPVFRVFEDAKGARGIEFRLQAFRLQAFKIPKCWGKDASTPTCNRKDLPSLGFLIMVSIYSSLKR